MTPINLDHAAATPVDPEVFLAMEPWLHAEHANPSAVYGSAHRARRALDDARASVARVLGCAPFEVVFTAGGTESDNLAVLGAVRAAAGTAPAVVTSQIEHSAVLKAVEQLEREGCAVTYVKPTRAGLVEPAAVASAVSPETVLVSVMLANNEIGTLQPVTEIAAAVKAVQPKTLVHTDACQAAGALSLNVAALGVDLLTINASKIYGPKGVGALYVRDGVKLQPLLFGGDQERGLRPGTENLAGIVGLAKALELAEARREVEAARLTALRDRLIDGILAAVPNSELNGDRQQRLPNNANILLRGVDGETLLFYLDEAGIEASLGSACTAGSIEPSHVLLAIGRSAVDSRRSLRLTLGRGTTDTEIDTVLRLLPDIVNKIRSLNS
jgi:cysteine desulfurase